LNDVLLLYALPGHCFLAGPVKTGRLPDRSDVRAGALVRQVAYAVLFVRSETWRLRMLWTIFLVLVVLWMLGVVSSYTLGGFIHVLLVLAVIALLVQLIQGRRVV
jgi:Family of unknown function (DUF5670)